MGWDQTELFQMVLFACQLYCNLRQDIARALSFHLLH